MGHYLANFTVYTMAMLGLIFFAIYVYKKFFQGAIGNNSSKILQIEETLSINPRKSLLVVSAGNEKFLIASDIDKTTLISKLESNCSSSNQNDFYEYKHFKQPANEKVQQHISLKNKIHLDPVDNQQKIKRPRKQNTVILDFDKKTDYGFSAMKEMAKKINEL